jgi:hypothetical protein
MELYFKLPYAFMVWWLIEHRDNFWFTFLDMGFDILKSGCFEVVRHIKSSEELDTRLRCALI